MIEKEYYRLDELEKRFDLTFSDIKYLIEKSKIDLVFQLNKTKFIIGGWLKDKGFVGYASVYYSGFARVTQEKQRLLISEGKINCNYFLLLNKESMSAQNTSYPFETKTPNRFLYAWEADLIKYINWNVIPAKLFPEEREHSIRTLGKMFNGILNNFDSKQHKEEKSESEFMAKVPKVEFYSKGITIQLSDICITHGELEKAKHYLFGNKDGSASNTKLRPIDTMLINMLNEFPNDRPSKIWERLKEDLNNEPRKFDTDEIIDELGDDTLYWFDSSAEIQKMKKKSFYNLVSRLKNN